LGQGVQFVGNAKADGIDDSFNVGCGYRDVVAT
jgi:hypothetical protein